MRELAQNIQIPGLLKTIFDNAQVTINGQGDDTIKVYDEQTFNLTMQYGSLGFGEAYMLDYWDADRLDQVMTKLLKSGAHLRMLTKLNWKNLSAWMNAYLRNLQDKKRAWIVGREHYDLGNFLFENMLDPRMVYSCGYWQHADNLAAAQTAKLDMICRKLNLQPGEHLLDIGCGWGSLAQYAAQHYGVKVTGVTVSREQQALAQHRCRDLDVSILLQDYRTMTGQFDKVASVGMFEHVGWRNYRTYFATVYNLIKPGGLFLLHSIGEFSRARPTNTWLHKYIFPNGMIPNMKHVSDALHYQWTVQDWHNFGHDYDRTLMAWYHNFIANWEAIRASDAERYDRIFYRMFCFYLLGSAGYFRSGVGQLWQLVLTRMQDNVHYRSYRPQAGDVNFED